MRIGLGASNAGTLLLPEVLGESAARELLLDRRSSRRRAGWTATASSTTSSRRRLDAAHRRAGSACSTLTTRPAVARTKRMLNDRFGDLLPEAMERETLTCVELFATPEAQEAVSGSPRKD